jgi:hypothetical protein
MKPTLMVCNRDVTLRTTYGSIMFEENKPRLVPPSMVADALHIGVLPVDQDQALFKEKAKKDEPVDPGTRAVRIGEAIEALYAKNDPDDFTAGASPKLVAVAREAELPKVGSNEVKTYLEKRNKAAFDKAMEQKKAKKKTPAKKKAAVAEPPDDDEYEG